MADEKSITTTLIPFTFETYDVRVHIDQHDTPWWEAQDVCAVLGIRDVSQAVARLKLGEKRQCETRNCLIINESGLYRLIFRSNKPEAERFQAWVFGKVLPSIRKTGTYVTSTAKASDPLEKYPELRAIQELILAVAEARDQALLAREEAHAADMRAVRAEHKADLALEDSRYLAVEEFVMKNGLMRQCPPSSYRSMSEWLKKFCLDYGLEIRKAPVYGKQWDDENTFPWQAFSAFLRAQRTRMTQITLVNPEGS